MNSYQIERIVGRGAFGTVYLCASKSNPSKQVIIKQIPMDQMSAIDRQVLRTYMFFSNTFESYLGYHQRSRGSRHASTS